MKNEFTHPFPLNALDNVKLFVEKKVEYINSTSFAIKPLILPSDILTTLQDELATYGLPEILNCVVFKRKNFPRPLINFAHIDYCQHSQEIINASIILPISGCEGTYMYWVDGEYETRISLAAGQTTAFQQLIWKSDYSIIKETEITVPTLCRVDIPHDAHNGLNTEYRTIASIRFKGNPSFEEILQKRFN
jgi:hypothetical protein